MAEAAEKKQQQKKKTVRRRIDPTPSHHDPSEGRFALINRDPDRHYVWAYINDDETGKGKYLAMRYRVEVQEPGGVRPVIGDTVQDGEEITASGHVLMSCSLERRQEIEQHGAFGEGGLALADRQEERMYEQTRDGAMGDGGFRGKFRGAGVSNRELGIGGNGHITRAHWDQQT